MTDTSNGWGGHSGTFVVPMLATGDGALNVTLTVHDNDRGEEGANAPETQPVRYSEPKSIEPATQVEPQSVDSHRPRRSSPRGPPTTSRTSRRAARRLVPARGQRWRDHRARRSTGRCHATCGEPAHAKAVAASSNREVRTVGATVPKPNRPSPVHRTPVDPAIAPHPDRADTPSAPRSVPRTIAVASDDAIVTGRAAVLFVLVLATGVAVLLRSRRRRAGAVRLAVAPAPPEPPTVVAVAAPVPEAPQWSDPRDLAIEAELQEMLAEHTGRQQLEQSRDGPLAGVS